VADRKSRTADQFLARHPELLTEDRTSPRLVRVLAALSAPLSAYFRFRIEGLERVPAGACLLVGNHSIAAPQEIMLLLRAWHRTMGDRPARGLVHRIAWQLPFRLLPLLPGMGGLFAHPEVAQRALARGHAVLVFPGGDVEALRPFSERYRVLFEGRIGFARLARSAGVPIVPVTLCGSHAAFLVLPGARQLARWTGVERLWGFKSFPLTGGLVLALVAAAATLVHPPLWPWLLAALVQMATPLPTRIEARVLAPITVRPDETDAEAAGRVQAAMQAAMDELAARRRTPVA